MDRRLTPANGRVAAVFLKGQVTAERFVVGERQQVCVGCATIHKSRDSDVAERQLLYGDGFLVLETEAGDAFGQAEKDGYVGYVKAAFLTAPTDPTHFVCTRATHFYLAPDIKSANPVGLSFGSRICVLDAVGRFWQTDAGGFVPKEHLRRIDSPMQDPAAVAELFLGTPYLWGGNTNWGLDCSGLVQAALLACGHQCPGDSDLQEQAVGTALDQDAPIRRGDLIFWKSHVAMAVSADMLIHANAHHMAVVHEPIDAVIHRIAQQGGGAVTSRKRL